jgi:type II secretory pathway pseudopilin PulG
MTIVLKKIFNKKIFKSFTIIEVLVALFIIGIAGASVVGLYSNAAGTISSDSELQKTVDFSNSYLTEIYLCDDLKSALFGESEISNLSRINKFPVFLKPWKTNIAPDIEIFITKKVNRFTPLMADVGIEAVIHYNKEEKRIKRYWVETSFSENYLMKMKNYNRE